MGGDREAQQPGHADRAQQAVPGNGSGASNSAAISAVAGAVASGPSAVAAVLRRFPGQRSATFSWLQSNCGNAFVQSVMADPPSGEAAAMWDVVATPHVVQFPETEVGAVSPPRTITLINRGYVALELASLVARPIPDQSFQAGAVFNELSTATASQRGPLRPARELDSADQVKAVAFARVAA